jgi:stage III sporulation protein AF
MLVIEGLKVWIINICTAIFFITAVEMLLPNNSLKKYAKFVLGLILITVVINPIIKLVNQDFNINDFTNKASSFTNNKIYDTKVTDYKEENLKNTIVAFKNNVQTTCEKELKNKFPSCNFKVLMEAQYDNTKGNFVINNVKVGIKDNGVEKVKKVDVNLKYNTSVENIKDARISEITDFLSKNLDISRNIISVYKL